jgi:hypothetical protein
MNNEDTDEALDEAQEGRKVLHHRSTIAMCDLPAVRLRERMSSMLSALVTVVIEINFDSSLHTFNFMPSTSNMASGTISSEPVRKYLRVGW